MANAQWPTGVNDKVLLGELEKPRPNVVRTAMSVGVPKIRRRSTQALREVDFDQIMTETEYGIFDDWFASTLQDGSLPFDLRLPSSGQVVKFQFRDSPPARLISPESYRVTLNLLQVP